MKNKISKILIIIFFTVTFVTSCAWAFSFRNMTLDLIHISDTHITSRQDTSYKALGSSKALLKDAVEQINKIDGVDFVLFTGDMVDTATYENFFEFYSILSRLKYPSLNAFGNHDIQYGDLSREEVLQTVKKYNPNYTFSDTYYAFSPKTDYRIVILDPTVDDSSTSNGVLPDEQLAFLDNELSQNQDKVVLIALHHPPVEPFVAKEHQILNADRFNEILLKYKNPIIVLSGHYHATKIRHWGNLVYVSTPSMVTYPMGFRHIKITNYKDRVVFNFEFIPTRLNEIKEQNRQSVISYGTLAGCESDRNYSFTFKKNQFKSVGYKRNKIKTAAKNTKTTKREIAKLTKPVDSKKIKVKKTKTKAEKNQTLQEKKIKSVVSEKIDKNREKKQIKKIEKEITKKSNSSVDSINNKFRNIFNFTKRKKAI